MRILALETSAKACSAAVTEDGRLIASAFQCTGLTHSRTLMPMVEDMMKNAELDPSDCDVIAVANGPGSFTGIRIGVSAAKGLAFGLGKPVAGVSTLEAMARCAAGMDGVLVCAMDARRQQVYNAVFEVKDGIVTRLTPDRAIGLENLRKELENCEKRKIIVGDGAPLCYNYFLENHIPCVPAPAHLLQQSAVGVAFAAADQARSGRLLSAQDLLPVYLRPSQAERLRRHSN